MDIFLIANELVTICFLKRAVGSSSRTDTSTRSWTWFILWSRSIYERCQCPAPNWHWNAGTHHL